MKKVKRISVYLILVCTIAIMLYPLFYIFTTSIKTQEDRLAHAPYALPTAPTLQNYISLLDSDIPKYFLNSLVVAAITLVLIVVLGALAAYPLEKMEFKGRKFIKNLFMVGVMIPIFVALVPMFGIYNTLGLRGTYWAVIIPQVGFSLPMAMYLYTAFLESLPNSLIESGYIDGAGTFRIFFHIVLPLLRNTTVSIAIFNFVFVWNEFIFANTFLGTASNLKTLPIGLNDFVGQYGLRDWGLTFAAVAATILPTLIIFFIFNKQVMEGMAAGAVKE